MAKSSKQKIVEKGFEEPVGEVLENSALETPPVSLGEPAVVQGPRGKIGTVIGLLARPEGASLEELCAATGWMPHSVRGAISGNLKKIRGLNVVLTGAAGHRRYVLAEAE
jgi:hypothetical protein